jgi:hypothetical protein
MLAAIPVCANALPVAAVLLLTGLVPVTPIAVVPIVRDPSGRLDDGD